MISLLIALSAATALQPAPTPAPTPAPAAAPARTLQALPGTVVTYYDVAGANGAAIDRSLKAIISAPAPNPAAQLFTWTADMAITKPESGTCTITSAKATLNGKVHLPRATEEAKVPPPELARWKAYVASLESRAAANLWFVADRLPTLEKALVGTPCDSAAAVWSKSIADLTAQQAALDKTMMDEISAKMKAEARKAARDAARMRPKS